MGLITVLKYSGTNLGSWEDLQKLPEDIMSTYYTRLHVIGQFRTSGGEENTHLMKCAIASNIYNKWFSNDAEPVEYHANRIFREILVEYKDEE